MPERGRLGEFHRHRPGRIEPGDPRGRAEVIHQAISPQKLPRGRRPPRNGNPLPLEAGDVFGCAMCPLPRDRSRVATHRAACRRFLASRRVQRVVRLTRLPQGAQPASIGQFNHITRAEPAAGFFGGQFEDAAHVPTVPDPITSPGRERGVAAGVGQQLRPGPVHRARVAPGQQVAVATRGHLQMKAAVAIAIGQLVEAVTSSLGPSEVAKSFPLLGPKPTDDPRPPAGNPARSSRS